ncbi:MAG: leucine--tRNA ligase [Acidobacteria bacterium]|nr:MAG: leucine--tRNA ligase [Acidobacteriota bacterium]
MSGYDFRAIEARWQRRWDERRTFRTPGPGDEGFRPDQPKFYVLDMFPYPSGAGLHVGHPLGYIATDIVARYKRMRGFNVLHPMGFDAFGLPAEQYAIEHGIHPRETTLRNIETMRRQLRALGLSYDWEREIATIDPRYYRWTQWIFLQMFGSWFDPEARRARPIAELEQELAAGRRWVAEDGALVAPGTEGARPWTDLDETARRDVLDAHRLAYVDEVPVNWCPALGTVLANEEVTAEGRSERGNHPVYRRPLRQWMLRITAYAERLLEDLDLVDWPEPIKLLQRNWIGRSEGAEAVFRIDGSGEPVRVFTTRPDTLFGATYMVLAPEHPLVESITAPERREAVEAYRREAARKSDVARQAETKAKTGVDTGARAINPVSGERIPVFIADYVLMGYGTGAIMAVPAHDQRDFEFALAFGLPLRAVVRPDEAWLRAHAPDALADAGADALAEAYVRDPAAFGEAFTGEGVAIQSTRDDLALDGLPTPEAKARITEWLERRGLGRGRVQYKLRDWLFSRQRYWGEPFPILWDESGRPVPVPEDELPVELPEMDDFRPSASDDPTPALARAPESWRIVRRGDRVLRRELNTMPQWAGSCWYYLRFIDPRNDERLVDPERERYFMQPRGVDLYVGGVEHAVLHLLYARFWHKVLYDLGHVSTPEPFGRLFNQGYILAWAYVDERGVYVPADEVEERDGRFWWKGREVTRSYGKMGKSLKNAVSPDEMCAEYGCDTLRLYEMFMGPLEASKPWNTRDVVGVHRFLQRLWRNLVDERGGGLRVTDEPADDALRRLLHRTIAQVTESMERLGFNTAIARLIELNNALVPLERVPREVAEPLVLMLAPMAPHIAEELWERLGHDSSLAFAPWPEADPRWLAVESVELVVQVLGKVRGKVEVPAGADERTAREAAQAHPNVARHLEGRTVRKVIYVPGKLINFVAS